MDQTPVYYENPCSKTIDFVGNREVAVRAQGGEKKIVTLFSLINVDVDVYTQLLVFKGMRDARIHEEVQNYDDWHSFHTAQKNAWCDRFTLLEWMSKIWCPFASTTQEPKLLILDSYPLHKEIAAKLSKFKTIVLYVPEGLTWKLQPLDTH